MTLLLCLVSTYLSTGSKPVGQKIGDNFAVSALLPADADAVSPAATPEARIAALATDSNYSPNFCATALQLRHWSKTVITVRVISEAKRDDAAQVVKGMALWNARTAPYLTLMPTDAENADITISFVTAGSLKDRAVGQTDVRFRLSDQVLTRATIRINEGLSDAQLVQVSAHEMGHALGIQGHSQDPRDLMFTHAHVPAQVTERDANTMFVSYAIPARKGVAVPSGAVCNTTASASPADLPTEDTSGTK